MVIREGLPNVTIIGLVKLWHWTGNGVVEGVKFGVVLTQTPAQKWNGVGLQNLEQVRDNFATDTSILK